MSEARTKLLGIKVTPSEYSELQRTADHLTEGNISQLVRNYVFGSQDEYRLLRRLGIIQTVVFIRDLIPTWNRGRQHTS